MEDLTGGFEGGGSDPELLYPAASVMAIPLGRFLSWEEVFRCALLRANEQLLVFLAKHL